MPTAFKTLIVDDERLARNELKRLLRAHPQCEIVAEAASAAEALAILAEQQIDLVFLDIQMPEVTGIELANDIPASTRFVFVTAFNSYALDAFSLNAIDYLLKPVAPERLAKTIARLPVADTDESPPTETEQQSNLHVLPEHHGILLKFGDINRIVRLQEIYRFESIGNHAAVYTAYGKSYLHSSLARIEQKLDPAYFFKTSRADIIRLDAIEHIEAGISDGGLVAVLNDGKQIDVSRRQAQQLKQRFGSF
ncbi:two component transcriptional regulator, LytTR family [Arsukibacterium tuosuense]|uniref:Two component transcriptional regulator, LytTR family n=1 Tax=Arsukibacterium tuosuense TaxID=1323745 RepID=A0A285IVQ9_9GAMM|nr:LytTR family DNA-binding domain-containing protein [Arsukibacterium tuosuense]SNY51757.1 two component transcriptional regulator, LytTR family [Arsukibacterium tuosuense]